ncbi:MULTISPECIES: hypothetical protein [Roseobacteraceae]|uniref:Uncharacterized protein n=1 Tax=Pseudosulfitobacter pseudonitzschiae TaxID=1402135 RepID=A0A221K372_9RHOB|nr:MULTISPECIES: hypothetical protein [Roseobacteraceae]ASM73330.1 hypothetical protein SULPSESMR1_02533 [Pseudosulfitobacter pseudonitzschiae]
MKRILMIAMFATAGMSTAALAADTKEQSCAYQAAIVAAVQAARMDGVKEQSVPETILASDHSWPEGYDAAIPIITPWVYEQKRRDLKTKDFAAAWSELCLQQ